MKASVREVLAARYPIPLVDELLGTYAEAKRNYLLGGHRLSAVEGGRFCEAVYRMLEHTTNGGRYTPLSRSVRTFEIEANLRKLPQDRWPRSVREHIPRSLRVVYDIRNNRDAAHLGDGIDPNLQDATLVVSVLNWIMAELVRLSDGTTPEVAGALVEELVTRELPAVQDFGEMPKVLLTDLRPMDHVLVVLYHKGPPPVHYADLLEWVPARMKANLRRTVRAADERALVHLTADMVAITRAGEKFVEERGLLMPLE